MSRLVFWVSVLLCFGTTAQAAILVISEDDAGRSEQYFEDGNFVIVANGKPEFGIDAAGNCWFIDSGQLVSDRCEQMLESMSSMREQAMAGMSARDRAMMEQMMAGQRRAAPSVRAIGQRTIAGYAAQCHAVGDAREVCVSRQLLDEVMAEMGNDRFTRMMQRFQDSAGGMGNADAQPDAVAELFTQGYPVSDMHKALAMPGMNAAMLEYLPKAQRAQIMQQMGGAGAQQMRGSRVVGVDKGARMPALDLSGLQRMSFAEYMQRAMGSMPGMPRGR